VAETGVAGGAGFVAETAAAGGGAATGGLTGAGPDGAAATGAGAVGAGLVRPALAAASLACDSVFATASATDSSSEAPLSFARTFTATSSGMELE
jgi:hypothetical protein